MVLSSVLLTYKDIKSTQFLEKWKLSRSTEKKKKTVCEETKTRCGEYILTNLLRLFDLVHDRICPLKCTASDKTVSGLTCYGGVSLDREGEERDKYISPDW